MSVDHFVPLYNPLLYNDILPHVAAASVILGMKSVAHGSPAFSSKASTFLWSKVLSHSYCLHLDLI